MDFVVTEIVACDAAQDWCLFRVGGNPAAQFGQAQIDPSVATKGLPIYEIHHAEGEKKGYDDGVITGLFVNVNCPGSIPEHTVSVIASQGASGRLAVAGVQAARAASGFRCCRIIWSSVGQAPLCP